MKKKQETSHRLFEEIVRLLAAVGSATAGAAGAGADAGAARDERVFLSELDSAARSLILHFFFVFFQKTRRPFNDLAGSSIIIQRYCRIRQTEQMHEIR